ncbi:heat shock cognate 70 kDa protein-like protein [Tanacetum coccineum]
MSIRARETKVGIDLGTTYSCVAAWFDKHNRVEIIPNEQGNKVTPSCVAWNGTELMVGEAAKNQIRRNPNNTVFDVKRLMGTKFSDGRVRKDIESWPFKQSIKANQSPLSYCVQMFKKKEKKDASKNAKAMMKLKVACENAKRDLSSTTITAIEVDSLYERIDFSMKFSRAKFEELNSCLFDKCIEHVKSCLRDANMQKNDVDDVVIVGGSTRIPKVQQMLMEFFDGKPLSKSINADEAVAYGAAVLAANLGGKGNEVVRDLILLDVTPLSLGIFTEVDDLSEDDMSVLIPKHTPIPTVKEDIYRTHFDNQVTMKIGVYQGESGKTKENILLDSFKLHGIPAAPKFEQKVKVRFNIDANGILDVSAEVISTGKKSTIRIAKCT